MRSWIDWSMGITQTNKHSSLNHEGWKDVVQGPVRFLICKVNWR